MEPLLTRKRRQGQDQGNLAALLRRLVYLPISDKTSRGPMNYESYKYLRIERDAGIATLTLNQPDNRNAIHAEMHAELEKVWLELAEDKEVNVIVFTGAGKFFSAGGDIKRMASRWGTDEGWRFSLEVPAATRR
eukprot:gene18456-37392_t